MMVSVAIIGAGPAGFYTAEALLDRCPDVQIDFIERLVTPYGLIRAGVAPDHQTTKKVSGKFEDIALEQAVQYFGNVEMGRDIHMDELRSFYDAVVLAVGSPADRPLNIPGENLPGVYGSTAFVGWYNAHPDYCGLDPALDTTAAVVIGNGNVAIDVARVLVKSKTELAESDIPGYAARAIDASPLGDIYIVGRRGPLEAKFTNVELRELGHLEQAVPVVDAADLPAGVDIGEGRERRIKEKNLVTLKEFADRSGEKARKRVHFVFHAAPTEILGNERVEAVTFEETRIEDGRAIGTGTFRAIECGLVVAAIGYRMSPIDGIPFDRDRGLVRNQDGRVEAGVYAVGWAKRGPTGVIASNRPDGITCAEQISVDIPAGSKPGRTALKRVLAERGVRAVSFDQWLTIDAVEVASAKGPAPRRKFANLSEMLTVIERTERQRSTGQAGDAPWTGTREET